MATDLRFARRAWLASLAVTGSLAFPVAVAQQPPNIGVAPVTLAESSYVFDTAEQHKIRVVVVAKGLKHPFTIAVLPSGDALVSERSGPMRLLHNGGGTAPGLDPASPQTPPRNLRSGRKVSSPCSAGGSRVTA